jgi:hypothetical protein
MTMTNKRVNRVWSSPPYMHGEYSAMCPSPYDPTHPTCTCTGSIPCRACKALWVAELLASIIFGPTKGNPKKLRKTRNVRKPTALAGDNAKGDEQRCRAAM